MPEGTVSLSAQPGSDPSGEGAGLQISPDLVRQVADRVYALLRRELEVERERQGRAYKSRPKFPQGRNHGRA
jgi:hypothetical protein